MDTFLKLLPPILGLIIAITPYLWRRFFARPELTIELKNIHSSSSQIGVSGKNIPTPDGYIDGNNAIFVYHQRVEFIVTVRNSSPHTAYYPQFLLNPEASIYEIEPLNNFKPILSAEAVELKGKYTLFHESKGVDRQSNERKAAKLEGLQILLEYKNALKTKVYTLFDKSAKNQNIILSKKPKKFKGQMKI
jgi:hypothetical protein